MLPVESSTPQKKRLRSEELSSSDDPISSKGEEEREPPQGNMEVKCDLDSKKPKIRKGRVNNKSDKGGGQKGGKGGNKSEKGGSKNKEKGSGASFASSMKKVCTTKEDIVKQGKQELPPDLS